MISSRWRVVNCRDGVLVDSFGEHSTRAKSGISTSTAYRLGELTPLNALNAALAVVRWKKVFGFYRDYEGEHHATYTIDTAMLLNEGAA